MVVLLETFGTLYREDYVYAWRAQYITVMPELFAGRVMTTIQKYWEMNIRNLLGAKEPNGPRRFMCAASCFNYIDYGQLAGGTRVSVRPHCEVCGPHTKTALIYSTSPIM